MFVLLTNLVFYYFTLINGMSNGKADPFGICSLRLKASSVLCLQCGKWNHGRCAGVKWVTPTVSRFKGSNGCPC